MYKLICVYETTLGQFPPHVRAVVLILFSTLCFTSMHTVIRYASTEGNIHPFEVAFFRNFFGLMTVLPFALRNKAAALRTKRLKLHAARGTMQVFAMLMFFYALSITPLAKVSAVSFTAPLFATLGAIALQGLRVASPQLGEIAAVIGLVQGGIQALSRSMFSQLIPQEKSAEFFGFYNVVGKAAAVFGPVMMGTIVYLTGNPRLGILSVALLFFAGMFFFRLVQDPEKSQPF